MSKLAGEIEIALVTVPDEDCARSMANLLVEEGWVACVNCLPGVRSFFCWEGKQEEASECLLVMKSTRERQEGLIRRIEDLHPYEVPEILFLPLAGGSRKYLDWVLQATQRR